MAEVIRMPLLSDTMTEGKIVTWNKKVGDKVKADDVLADVETDKATMEFESFQNGTLLHVGVQEGKGAPVDSILAILGKEGEDISALLAGEASKSSEAKEEVKTGKEAEVKDLFPLHTTSEKESKNGNYISLTFQMMMPSSEAVITVYQKASAIEGLIAL